MRSAHPRGSPSSTSPASPHIASGAGASTSAVKPYRIGAFGRFPPSRFRFQPVTPPRGSHGSGSVPRAPSDGAVAGGDGAVTRLVPGTDGGALEEVSRLASSS